LSCPVWIHNAQERPGGRSSLRGERVDPSALRDTPQTFYFVFVVVVEGRIKKKPVCTGIAQRGFLFYD